MPTNITVPTTTKSQMTLSIGRWFKRSGDPVAIDEPLVEINTDSVTREIRAPVTGVLSQILVRDGESVEPHTGLGTIASIKQARSDPLLAAIPRISAFSKKIPSAIGRVTDHGRYDDTENGDSRSSHISRDDEGSCLPGTRQKALEDHPKPDVTAPTDAIIKITKTTICGTDLHILKGDVPTCQPGRILGHEGVGIIDKVGPAVTAFKPGDRVLISCITACGKCEYCRRGMYSHCTTGGWILGNEIDGTQAEYVRIPHADTSLYPVPQGADEEALVMLSDILPTGFECGVLNGKVAPGSTVAIVGSGPIGLAALLTAQLYSPAEIIMIDLDDNRLGVARKFGATQTINSTDGKASEIVMTMTGKRGVDTAIEAVGIPATFELCEQIIAPGGTIANIGVHGAKVDLHLERLWSQNIAITTRLVDTVTTPMLLKTVQSKKIDPTRLITHRFKLDHILDAYETFENAAKTKALKVIIEA